jgi:hypothetical protein
MIAVVPAITRPVEEGDLEDLQRLDADHAHRLGIEPIVDRAVLAYYGRSGHAFVHETVGGARGFVLAHAVWDGARPVLRIGRMVGDDEALSTLLEAVVRSAYDAAVYDLVAEPHQHDEAAQAALALRAFDPAPVVRFERTLGSRGRNEVPE